MGLLDHIGPACKQARERVGLRQIDIATEAGTTHASISRFETGNRQAPQRVDDLVAAYAAETGRTERQLWQAAMRRWQRAE